jgi:hypothetical protein
MDPLKPTAEEIARHYSALFDSVAVINDYLAGNKPEFMSADDFKASLDRNVSHLEIMVAKDFWTTEDMSAVEAAITAGKAALG